MRLTREYNLHRLKRMQKNALQPVKIVKNKIGALVAGESAREPNRENLWIEQSSKRNHTLRTNAFTGPLFPRALVDVLDQKSLEPLAQTPEFLVRDVVNCLPGFGLVLFAGPVGTKEFVE